MSALSDRMTDLGGRPTRGCTDRSLRSRRVSRKVVGRTNTHESDGDHTA